MTNPACFSTAEAARVRGGRSAFTVTTETAGEAIAAATSDLRRRGQVGTPTRFPGPILPSEATCSTAIFAASRRRAQIRDRRSAPPGSTDWAPVDVSRRTSGSVTGCEFSRAAPNPLGITSGGRDRLVFHRRVDLVGRHQPSSVMSGEASSRSRNCWEAGVRS